MSSRTRIRTQDRPKVDNINISIGRRQKQQDDNFVSIWGRVKELECLVDNLTGDLEAANTLISNLTNNVTIINNAALTADEETIGLVGTVLEVKRGLIVIAPSATEIIDTVNLTNFSIAKWFLRLDEGSQRQSSQFEARALGTVIECVRYAILGQKISFTTSVISDGSIMTFSITNNESTDLTVRFRRNVI